MDDAISRSQGNPGAVRVIKGIVDECGVYQYLKVAPFLACGPELYGQYITFFESYTSVNPLNLPSFKDFVKSLSKFEEISTIEQKRMVISNYLKSLI